MTARIQDAAYVANLALLPFLTEFNSQNCATRCNTGESPLSFAASISAAHLAHGDCVLVRPLAYHAIEWSLGDFRERLGLHSAGIVKVES